MKIWKKLFDYSWKRYLAALAICIVFAVINLLVRDLTGFSRWGDALSTGGAICLLLGLLILFIRLGVFDLVNYSFGQLSKKNQKRDYFTYTQDHKKKNEEKGWTFMPYLTVGLAFTIIGLLMFYLAK